MKFVEYISILKTLGLNEEWLNPNKEKLYPALDTIDSVDELNGAIDYAEKHNISLVTQNGTLKRIKLVECAEKSLTDNNDYGFGRAA